MVKIISNENIKQLETQRLIDNKIANHELNKEARPVKAVKPRLRIPKSRAYAKPKKIDTEHLSKMINIKKNDEFNEYKESLDRVMINSISSLDPLDSSEFKEKLKASNDIKTILKNTVLDNLNFTSYPTVLCATVLTLWLESKLQ